MSRHTQALVLSMENIESAASPMLENVGQTLDDARTHADAPVIELHGIQSTDKVAKEIRDGLGTENVLLLANDQLSMESQQIDAVQAAQDESRATALAGLQQEADDVLTGRKKVYILHGSDPADDDDKGLHSTFSALAKSAVEDPANTVAAFLPADPVPGNDALPPNYASPELEQLEVRLRNQGVAVVHSTEALIDHLNVVLENHHGGLEFSLEASNPLRAGKNVKFSHGIGKIVKVFDKPFKYKGKHYHATKDAPWYEVRGKHGLSIHRASALKLV